MFLHIFHVQNILHFFACGFSFDQNNFTFWPIILL